MSGFMRASLATITIVGIAGLALRLSGYGERIATAYQRFEADFQPWFDEGPLGRVLIRYYAPVYAWLYSAYAKGLGLEPEDEVLDVACGSGSSSPSTRNRSSASRGSTSREWRSTRPV